MKRIICKILFVFLFTIIICFCINKSVYADDTTRKNYGTYTAKNYPSETIRVVILQGGSEIVNTHITSAQIGSNNIIDCSNSATLEPHLETKIYAILATDEIEYDSVSAGGDCYAGFNSYSGDWTVTDWCCVEATRPADLSENGHGEKNIKLWINVKKNTQCKIEIKINISKPDYLSYRDSANNSFLNAGDQNIEIKCRRQCR